MFLFSFRFVLFDVVTLSSVR